VKSIGEIQWIDSHSYTGKFNLPCFLLCLHGKSLHTALWDAEGFLKSNRNLIRVSESVLKGEYVLPNAEGSLLDSLNGKMLVCSYNPTSQRKKI
jgi:hypothetical protein